MHSTRGLIFNIKLSEITKKPVRNCNQKSEIAKNGEFFYRSHVFRYSHGRFCALSSFLGFPGELRFRSFNIRVYIRNPVALTFSARFLELTPLNYVVEEKSKKFYK